MIVVSPFLPILLGQRQPGRSRNTYEESNFADVPVPGTPGASAYSE